MEETKTDEVVEETKKVDTQTTEKNEENTEVKTFTQDEVNDLIEKRLGREKKNMPNKEELDKFHEWQESQKTTEQKNAEKEKENLQKDSKISELTKENAVLKSGVNYDDVDYIIYKVSKLDGEFDENLEKFLKDNPKYLSKNSTYYSTKATGSEPKGSAVEKDDGVMSILKAKHPELYK